MTRPDRTLLLVGGNDDALVRARRVGVDVLLLQHPAKLTDRQAELAADVSVVDYTDWAATEPVVRDLHDRIGFRHATSLTEPGLENAGRVNDLYGLGGTGYQVAHLLRDKLAMRRHLEALDPVAPAAAPLLSRRDLDDFGDRNGYPFVVKPTDATGGVGVVKVTGPADGDRIWEHVRALSGTRTDRVTTLFLLREFLMEEYVPGPEVSVEALSFAGRHVVVAVTEKFLDQAGGRFAEIGHALPARLPAADREPIVAAVTSFLDRVGLRDGVSHTELRLGGGHGPVVIESHNRIAGDAIAELVEGAYGIDLSGYAFGWPFGLVEPLAGPPEATAGACARFVVGPPGRVIEVQGADRAAARPGVLDVRVSTAPGATVHALRDNWDRLALVAATGADTADAIERAAQVAEEDLVITIEGEDGAVQRARVAPVDAEARL